MRQWHFCLEPLRDVRSSLEVSNIRNMLTVRCRRSRQKGLTLVELILGAGILAVAITALLGAFLWQLIVIEHARCLSWATTDASRVLERMRQQNSGSGCTSPSVAAPSGFASWDAWLASAAATGGGGKTIQPNPTANELIAISSSGTNPLQVTVAVCWRHRERTIGECTWNGSALAANPAAGGDTTITESPAMLSTLMTCRQ